MELIALLCAQCGAPLEAPTNASFITCRHCSCHLAIKHSESATWSERLEAISEQTRELAADLKTLMLERELERIDRDWEKQRKPLMHRGNKEPTVASVVFMGIGNLALSAYIAHLIVQMRAWGVWEFMIFAVFPLIYWIIIIRSAMNLMKYWDLRDEYLKRRTEALARFEATDANVEC